MRRLAISLKMLFVFLLFMVSAGCYVQHEKYVPAGVPRFFNEDYDRVWDAVVDTLDERGFVINQMRKEEGYVDTKNKQLSAYERERVTIRLLKEEHGVSITVSDHPETAELRFKFKKNNQSDSSIAYWKQGVPSGEYQQWILDHIEAKLRRKR
ncbi:MAG: hypothetical protein HY893_03590 [Deltaproteobacteria bacterium]|nr:hypothetical protein [Deltaproteobacteria bacterium]